MTARAVGITAALAEQIRREGPLPFDRFLEAALYDPSHGFYAKGGGAGRATGDFITSPEVGPLFGRLVARALDQFWDAMGRPDPFVVVDAGAGRGQLARTVLAAAPDCLAALRYLLVERSDALRRVQAATLPLEPAEEALGPSVRDDPEEAPTPVTGIGPIVAALADLPARPFTGVVVANELFDNLAFRIVERDATGWREVRVGIDDAGGFREVEVPAAPGLAAECDALLGAAAPGARLPLPTGVARWLHECAAVVRRGVVIVVDYADDVAASGDRDWIRTYGGHARGTDALAAPGTVDITADVPLDALRGLAAREGFRVESEMTQAEWLRGLRIDELVDEGRRIWHERAHLGDLVAVEGRSRVTEADALLDLTGLGAHRVIVLTKGTFADGGQAIA